MRRLALALLLAAAPALAAEAPDEAVGWLQRIAQAARTLNYSGTFVYRQGDRMETSRIVHAADASGEHEKLESMDGSRREVIRNNDEVKCYLPDARTVKVEKRRPGKTFPALLPEQIGTLTENYRVRLGGRERIAGFDCQVVILEPHDGLRYGHRLWADASTGLLLKAAMLDGRGNAVEEFAFTQLSIGAPIGREELQSRHATGEWRQERAAPAQPRSGASGWLVGSQPPGFRKVFEMTRSLPGKTGPVTHIMLSDGLVGVSVFIEPAASARPERWLARQGAVHVFTRPVAEHTVTVLGETPEATIMQIGNSVSFQGR